MRDIASCFGDYAVAVADSASCATSTTTTQPSTSTSPVLQDTSTSLYNIILSTQKKLIITLTWSKTHDTNRTTLNITIDNSSSLPTFKLNTNSMFKRLKGAKVFMSKNTKVEVIWDLSAAKYQNGPEPVNGYYVLVMIDSELGLILGDMAKDEANKRFKNGAVFKARASLVSRRERCSGSTVYSTRARFTDSGLLHEISVRCVAENDHNQPFFSVCIDKKSVVHVKRLKWNFRGNQSIFIDGLEIDFLWDLHDWLFNPSSSGYAVFAFRVINVIQNGSVWSEQKLCLKHQADTKGADFMLLMIQTS